MLRASKLTKLLDSKRLEFKQVNPKALDFYCYIILREKEKEAGVRVWTYERTFKISWKC